MSLNEQPFQVRDNLFIGNISHAAKILQGGDAEITHILSLLSSASISFFLEWRPDISIHTKEIEKVYVDDGSPTTSDAVGGLKNASDSERKLLYSLEQAGPGLKQVRMAVPLRDMEHENLLDCLDACLNFIDKSRKEGGILVHCFAGVSRSAAVVTAYLMKTEHLSQEDALDVLRLSCDTVCPNDGFLEQLKMFEDMGFSVDHDSPVYKRFHLKQLGEYYNQGNRVDLSKVAEDPGSSQLISNCTCKTAYRCKRCRRVVAVQGNVVTHTPGEGEICFESRKWRMHGCMNQSDESECSSVFIEPLKWMTAVGGGTTEGKLFCIKCDARLGYFNWSGIQCSCGSWITPAFQLHKSRVDHSTV